MSDFFTDTDMIGPPTNDPVVLNFGAGDLIVAPLAIQTDVMLSAEEARQIVKNINGRFEQSRKDLIELHDREGWRALGYDNWRDCVQAEFQQSAAYLYRQLAAAKIEQLIESPIGEIPESHLRPLVQAKINTQETIKRALSRADALAGDQPRTAKHIEQAAKEIAAPDLPLEFAVIQRRYEKHGHVLSSAWDGKTQRFIVRKDGGTGVVMLWPDVLSKLEKIEAAPDPDPAHAERLEEQIESDRIPEARMEIGAAAYEQKEQRDRGRLLRARTLIGNREFAAERVVLDQIEVATWERDKLLQTIPTGYDLTLRLTLEEGATLRKEAKAFESSGLIAKLPTIGQALTLLIERMQG